MKKLRTGDDVVVITGKDKGRRGQVVKVLPNGKLVVQGVNMAKKHQKPNALMRGNATSRAPIWRGTK